ncbi:hypothetical protein [Agrococcus beijingensis]|uniref:hypothetical protein n=1 Tax=Agrococcus beijingensis TaxID=3068634 RepID=UPI0027421211|nr:hypothetical protein [Agrococcus sp. REN33]
MALPAAGSTLPNDTEPQERDAAPARPTLIERLRRPRVLLAIALTVLIGAGLAVYADLSAKSEPIALLGAVTELPGGVARVNGIIPLETDGWLPDDAPAVLTDAPAEGSHRVRILLELTALGEDGIAFSADDYTILGLGAGRVSPLWASPGVYEARQGEVLAATLVFEIPNQAVELTLEGEDGGRLALGVKHHTADR